MEEEAAADPSATSVIRAEDLETMASEQRPDPGATATIDPSAVQAIGAVPADSVPPYEAPSEPAWQSPQPAAVPAAGSSWKEQLGIATAPTPQAGLAGLTVPSSVQDRLSPLEGVGKQILTWAGAVLLIVGLFVSAKTYSASFVSASASRSLWDYGTFWAVILLLLALVSAGLAYIRDYKWLLVTGAASLLICILEFLYAFSNEIEGVSSSAVSAHPSWGWILLFPGALLILVAGATRPTERDAANDAGLNTVVAQLRSRVGNR